MTIKNIEDNEMSILIGHIKNLNYLVDSYTHHAARNKDKIKQDILDTLEDMIELYR